MLALSRETFRCLAIVLALVMASFPAVSAWAAGGRCCSHDEQAASAVQCCARHESEPDESSTSQPETDRHCGLTCLSLCCRAIDVPRGDMCVSGASSLVVPVILMTQSIHTPITCDAIFHPPRA